MRSLAIALLGTGVSLTAINAGPTPAPGLDEAIWVDCTAPPGGNGTAGAPLSTITSAVTLARGCSGSRQIEVVDGVCDRETFPITLDFPVRVRGSQQNPTAVTAAILDETATFFNITADDVELTDLTLDGRLPLGPDVPTIPPGGPFGISAVRVDDLELRNLRLTGMGEGVRIEASNGRLSDSDISARSGVFLSGGNAANPPLVEVRNNRIVYRINGIIVAGTFNVGPAIRAIVEGNEVRTSFTNTGVTTPAALRVAPMAGASPNGTVNLLAKDNDIIGPALYGIMLHAGQPTRGGSYTGRIDAEFDGNAIDSLVVNRALITFTNSRATVRPSELRTTWEYLRGAQYVLRHRGELTNALIDHPEFHPISPFPRLGNLLRVNDKTIANRSFVIVPPQ